MYIFSPWGLCGTYGCGTNVISLPPIGATIHFHNSHIYSRGWGRWGGGGRGGSHFTATVLLFSFFVSDRHFQVVTHSAITSLMSIISGKKMP